jgi:hypothetical protein
MTSQNEPDMAALEAIRANYSLTDEQRQIVDHVDIMPAHETLPAMTDHDQIASTGISASFHRYGSPILRFTMYSSVPAV